jgi:hypothetical protein
MTCQRRAWERHVLECIMPGGILARRDVATAAVAYPAVRFLAGVG